MQQITRGDYLKDLITIFIENNLQTDITELYSQFIFQCGEIQKVLTPAQVIKISFDEIESQLLKSTNTCYLAGITTDGHKETFNGSLTFNTRGEVVYYEPPVSTVIPAATETNCDCQGLRGVFYNCSQPAVKAYFSLNYVPTKLSELQNDTGFVDSFDLTRAVSEHNTSTEAHQYIQDLVATEASLRASQTNALGIRIGTEESVRASQTEALHQSILAEATAREEAISLAISTTEGYADTQISNHNSSEQAHPYIQSALVSATEAINVTIGDLDNLDTANKSSVVNAINSEVTARENADNNLQTQIDGLAAASDVTDIVGTYQELQNYDTQHLNNNDIIKVLSDETHDDEPSYYRFNKTSGTFSYIGSESASYTKAQSDSIFVTQTTEINGHALSSDINLTASDVGALSDTTTINDLTNTAQQNALNSGVTSSVVSQVSTNTSAIATNTSAIASNTSVIAQHTTAIASNTSDISTINGKIPTDASTSNKLVSASTLAASIADFANQDLSNLTSNGEARLHALKSYADEGELLTDPDGLAFVEKYNKSTFDASKFTKVGSPIVTDDGIASGFSDGNYLTIPNNLSNKNSWSVIIPANISNFSSTTGGNDLITGQTVNCLGLSINTSGKLVFSVSSNGTSWNIAQTKQGITTLSINTKYYFKIEFTGMQYKAYYSTDLKTWNLEITVDSTDKIYNVANIFIGIGRDGTDRGVQGTIDLKQFSITVDGVPVFSGNKTGIDTIKSDNYTVVGTPVISADGIYQAAGGSNYIYKTGLGLTSDTGFQLFARFCPKSYTGNNQDLFYFGNYDGTRIWLNSTKIALHYQGYIGADSVWFNTSNLGDNEYVNLYLKLKSGSKCYFEVRKDNGTLLPKSSDFNNPFTAPTLPLKSHNTLYFGRYDSSKYNNAKIDLNAVKVCDYDGNLVYQPCLKIPYTKSKTGSKIVDSIYRDRVNDMASQFGYANYYTLDEENGNFTLPQVELYGLIGQRTLRDSYRNGINYWELYSNRDLEQGGSCTSGVEVTFARPFADTNYVLSVPYSAKSATAFTPTQTGDWIAKGRGLL